MAVVRIRGKIMMSDEDYAADTQAKAYAFVATSAD
jgi:hypothetical protein